MRRLDGLLRRSLSEDIDIKLVLATDLGHANVDPAQLEVALLNWPSMRATRCPAAASSPSETANAELDEHDAQHNEDATPGPYIKISSPTPAPACRLRPLKKVFEPFFTTKELGKGTGLGLSMVYGFVKQSDGHVNISSEIGKGTTVTLFLPRSADTTGKTPMPSEPVEIRGGSETILVVEDDDMVRSYVHSQLAALGYDVLIAHNGQEALDILRREKPIDLLFTDIVMPGGMNGSELMEAALRLRPTLRSSIRPATRKAWWTATAAAAPRSPCCESPTCSATWPRSCAKFSMRPPTRHRPRD